ncbi:MAG: phosphoribosylanthranilate isomerase [Nitrospirota bacterium]
MTKVKICGITNVDDALAAAEYGVDALGFIFYQKSLRYITPEKARHIISELPPFITTVGVFVDEEIEKIKSVVDECDIDIVQFHGNESPDFCLKVGRRFIKAIRVKDELSLDGLENYRCEGGICTFLLDTYATDIAGGTGESFDWTLALSAKNRGRIILSGGLNPDNVVEAIRIVRPYGVDVASGVESRPGRKDLKKMKLFIDNAKST